MKLSELKNEGYEGIDASLEISLFEYGLVWIKNPKEPPDYLFIYGVGADESSNYNMFDHAHIPIDTDPLTEWDWANFDDVASCAGTSKEEFLKGSLPMIIFDLIMYYGHENIFGSSYYPYEIENI